MQLQGVRPSVWQGYYLAYHSIHLDQRFVKTNSNPHGKKTNNQQSTNKQQGRTFLGQGYLHKYHDLLCDPIPRNMTIENERGYSDGLQVRLCFPEKGSMTLLPEA